MVSTGPRIFFNRNTSRFLFDRSRHRSWKNGGPHQCGRRNFLQKGYSLSHRVSRRPEISKNSMFLSCFAGVFFVICFDFYLNKFGATVDFQSDVEIDGDSHAVFSARKLSQKLSLSWSKTVRRKFENWPRTMGPKLCPKICPKICPKTLGSKIEWRPALKVFGRFWGGFLGASKNHHF